MMVHGLPSIKPLSRHDSAGRQQIGLWSLTSIGDRCVPSVSQHTLGTYADIYGGNAWRLPMTVNKFRYAEPTSRCTASWPAKLSWCEPDPRGTLHIRTFMRLSGRGDRGLLLSLLSDLERLRRRVRSDQA